MISAGKGVPKNQTMMVNSPGWRRTAWHSDEPSSNPTSLGLIPLPHCKVLKNHYFMYFLLRPLRRWLGYSLLRLPSSAGREEGHLSKSHCLIEPTKKLPKSSDGLCSVLILRAGKQVKRPGKPLQGKSPPAEPQQLGLSPFVGCCARRGLYIIQNLVSIRFLGVELKKRPIVVWKNKEFYHESSTISGSSEECGKRLPLPLWLNRMSQKSLHGVFSWKVIKFQ